MSRIDQALRVWEGAKGTESPVVDPTPSPLGDYPLEDARQAPPEPLTTPPMVPPSAKVPPVASVAEPRRAPKPSARLSDSAEIQARLVTGASSSVSLEQYRRLAAVLHEEQVQGKLKSVMVTSAVPTEGKTLTLVNLALTLSGSYGRRVLLIDADLRAPSLHRLLEIRNTRGLSEALREGGRDLPIVEVATGLSVLTAGRPGPTPLADLTSERIGNVIRECSASFDWVLIDTPPVGLLPDAQVLARIVGAVVFVIAAGSTPAAAVERAISEVGPDSIIGTVLNRVEDRRIPDANYYTEYYGDHDGE
jgi:capsular exopolysaccharide synthesis family protein